MPTDLFRRWCFFIFCGRTEDDIHRFQVVTEFSSQKKKWLQNSLLFFGRIAEFIMKRMVICFFFFWVKDLNCTCILFEAMFATKHFSWILSKSIMYNNYHFEWVYDNEIVLILHVVPWHTYVHQVFTQRQMPSTLFLKLTSFKNLNERELVFFFIYIAKVTSSPCAFVIILF